MNTIAPDTRPLAERITQGTFRAEGGKILYGPTILDPRPMGGTVTGCVAIIQGSALRNYSDNATLVVEAFNVTHETGRTPRQLADERAELTVALAEAVAYIQAGFPELEEDDETITTSADEGPEATFHYAAALRLLSRQNN